MADPAARPLQAKVLATVPHGFCGKAQGDMGLGGEDLATVTANRLAAAEAVLSGGRLVSLKQVHSPDCVVVDKPWDESDRPEADAMVTNQRGLVLGIVTADCAPVLFADAAAGVIGAAHAGWRGAFTGVLEATIVSMEGLGASRSGIRAAIGPCIAQASYEVDEGFHQHLIDQSEDNAAHFAPGKPGHWQFDLEGYCAARLEAAGIGGVECLGRDTCAEADSFFSFRRATLAGEPDYGRQFSLIALS